MSNEHLAIKSISVKSPDGFKFSQDSDALEALMELKEAPKLLLSPKSRVSEEHNAKKSFDAHSSSSSSNLKEMKASEESKKSLNLPKNLLESFEGSMSS